MLLHAYLSGFMRQGCNLLLITRWNNVTHAIAQRRYDINRLRKATDAVSRSSLLMFCRFVSSCTRVLMLHFMLPIQLSIVCTSNTEVQLPDELIPRYGGTYVLDGSFLTIMRQHKDEYVQCIVIDVATPVTSKLTELLHLNIQAWWHFNATDSQMQSTYRLYSSQILYVAIVFFFSSMRQ